MNERIPDRVTVDGLESRWDAAWEENGTYRFDATASRDQVYSIDTPPPTVSGSLHVGHVFSYTHTDVVARYQRMCGRAVFYPMGWDDNGLPTERRVQNYYGVRCDPHLPYDPDFTPPHEGGDGKSVMAKDQVPIGRKNFVELCERLTEEDEKQFEELWRRLGLSVDWSHTYQTISPDSIAVAQQAFVRNLQRGEAYQSEAPTLWDVTFRTAVAQAELEERDRAGAYHRLAFQPTGDDSAEAVHIETTRPELLPACVALVAHPDDERYQGLFGTTVRTPLFDVEVPVVAHRLADPEKGSGIAMICTFGDVTDVTWWRELQLDMRPIVGRDGRIMAEPPQGIESPEAQAAYGELAGLTVFSAQKKIVELLAASGGLVGEPRAIDHPVKFFEKGDKPLEIVTSRQWYISNGGKDEALRKALLARGEALDFVPSHMGKRYEKWVNGLTGDWLISRQRFFGVPIPVWYPLDDAGEVDYDHPIVPAEEALPVDPSADTAPGYEESMRGEPGGFIGEEDVMDTWATSSLTPQIATGWRTNQDLHARTYPMDLRPQGQDIIRTWLFSTVVRAHLEDGTLPWKHAAISGWILDPDRKKMSKSKGNVVTPMGLLEEHGSDAVRYWAASARLGTDAAFDTGQMKIGRRLAMKILNASKFVLGVTGLEGAANASLSDAVDAASRITGGALASDGSPGGTVGAVTNGLDRAMLAVLAEVVEEATTAFDAYDHTRALEVTENYFWKFCDDYLELVKLRAYDGVAPGEAVDASAECSPEAASARAALTIALETFLRLFAPFVPFATEEVWSWWREGSVHQAPWPQVDAVRAQAVHGIPEEQQLPMAATSAPMLEAVGEALSALRKVKSEAKVKQKTVIESVELRVPESKVPAVEFTRGDLEATARVEKMAIVTVPDKDADGQVAPVTTANAVLATES